MPHLITGSLMRHYRIAAGLSYQRARELTAISNKRLHGIELTRSPLTEETARTLLHAYGAPGEDVQVATALLRMGHAHQAQVDVVQSGSWVSALREASQETLIFSTGLLLPVVDATAPGTPARGRATHHCRTVLLLHEGALERAPAELLAQLIRLVDRRAITVRLVHSQFAPLEGWLTEWTLTAGSREGSAAERARRQLYVRHTLQERFLARNGHPALQDRQIIQAAIRHSLPTAASADQLRQAMLWSRSRAATGGRRNPAAAPSDGPSVRRPA
ncbi:hypothetical protein AQJ11_37695 [Streptomyces corchorusii]|uniref:Uncharacterized protein n=2 Tax=Streptomyces TaxID=1883 RepID=A0A101PTX2_STRCK|nr:helix-turn-helix domain-containing protein [Streptomyces corchorusii]KUN17600.1 hypothetical protein AQJ11_37695 [Streptomyces corchorusii]